MARSRLGAAALQLTREFCKGLPDTRLVSRTVLTALRFFYEDKAPKPPTLGSLFTAFMAGLNDLFPTLQGHTGEKGQWRGAASWAGSDDSLRPPSASVPFPAQETDQIGVP